MGCAMCWLYRWSILVFGCRSFVWRRLARIGLDAACKTSLGDTSRKKLNSSRSQIAPSLVGNLFNSDRGNATWTLKEFDWTPLDWSICPDVQLSMTNSLWQHLQMQHWNVTPIIWSSHYDQHFMILFAHSLTIVIHKSISSIQSGDVPSKMIWERETTCHYQQCEA